VTGKPDGTAISIRIFQSGVTIRPAQIPMAGAQQGNVMTNASIESFDGKTLVVAAGDTIRLTVPADVEVLKPLPATFADLAVGKRITASGVASPDSNLVATAIYIPGLAPR